MPKPRHAKTISAILKTAFWAPTIAAISVTGFFVPRPFSNHVSTTVFLPYPFLEMLKATFRGTTIKFWKLVIPAIFKLTF
jgi:hypothetical protein